MKKYLMSVFGIILMLVAATVFADDYVIGDGDGLQIHVWGEPSLSSGVSVRPDGKITLAGVGDVTASGFTAEILSEKLTEELEKIVKKPIVTVTVTGINNSKVYVFGGGPGTGVHGLPGRTTLLKFLIGLGDLQNADLEKAHIIRDGKIIYQNFYPLYVEADLTKDLLIESNDLIYIPSGELNKIYVMGAVNSPKYIFHRKTMRILDAILEAGGFTKFAKENSVLILRRQSNQIKEIQVKVKDLMKEGDFSQNILLEQGDFVIVKEGIF